MPDQNNLPTDPTQTITVNTTNNPVTTPIQPSEPVIPKTPSEEQPTEPVVPPTPMEPSKPEPFPEATDAPFPLIDENGPSTPPTDIPQIIGEPEPKKKFLGGKIIPTILGLLILVGGVSAGVYLVKQQQELRSKAGFGCNSDDDCGDAKCVNHACVPIAKKGNTVYYDKKEAEKAGAEPITNTNSSAVDLQTDSNNCGSVGTKCAAGATCSGGKCSGSSSSSNTGCTATAGQVLANYGCCASGKRARLVRKTDCSTEISCQTDAGCTAAECSDSVPCPSGSGKACVSGACVLPGGSSTVGDPNVGGGGPSGQVANDLGYCNGTTITCTTGLSCSPYHYCVPPNRAIPLPWSVVTGENTRCGSNDVECGTQCCDKTKGQICGTNGCSAGSGSTCVGINLLTDNKHCGNCDTVCQAGKICSQGKCVTGSGGGEGGGGGGESGTPIPTTTPVVTNQCLNIKIFDTSWNEISTSSLSTLSSGKVIRFTVAGSPAASFDKAKFVINGTEKEEVTGKRPSTNEYYYEYTLPSGIINFTINAKLHLSASNQWI